MKLAEMLEEFWNANEYYDDFGKAAPIIRKLQAQNKVMREELMQLRCKACKRDEPEFCHGCIKEALIEVERIGNE